jgi:prepilin-type N-terminal cleavage/methylation domain-containing protein
MTLRDPSPARRPARSPGVRSGFTLIELILVLGLLLIVAGISFPTLKNFFRGRALDSEARRFLSLTRYGQSRAAAEGLPMVLWIDPQEQTYGLQAETGYLDLDRKAVEYELDESLTVEVAAPTSLATTAGLPPPTIAASVRNSQLPAIRFTAEGYLEATCPEAVIFRQGDRNDESALWILQTGNRLNYEISANPPATLGR